MISGDPMPVRLFVTQELKFWRCLGPSRGLHHSGHPYVLTVCLVFCDVDFVWMMTRWEVDGSVIDGGRVAQTMFTSLGKYKVIGDDSASC